MIRWLFAPDAKPGKPRTHPRLRSGLMLLPAVAVFGFSLCLPVMPVFSNDDFMRGYETLRIGKTAIVPVSIPHIVRKHI